MTWGWLDDRAAFFRAADDGCPHCGADFEARLSVEEREAILAKYERYAWRLAIRMRKVYPKFRIEDLFSEVRFAFVVAATKFDPAMGYVFTTYATWWARQYVQRLVAREGRQGMRFAPEERLSIISLSKQIVGRGQKCDAMSDTLPAKATDAEEERFPADFWQRVSAVLDKRSAFVLELHFREGLNFRLIGEELGVTRERIRQIVKTALEKLKLRAGEYLEALRAA